MYGQNYIYEPIYYNTPLIYNSFFGPIITDRMYQTGIGIIIHHILLCLESFSCVPIQKQYSSLNINNNYNYVNYRRSNQAVVLYNRRSNGYERSNNNFRENTNVSNRYELEQRSNRNEINYSQKKPIITSEYIATRSQRDISQNRNQSARKSFSREEIKETTLKKRSIQEKTLLEAGNLRTDTQNRNTNTRETAPEADDKETMLKTNQILQENAQQRTETQETILRTEIILDSPQRTDSQRSNSQSRTNSSRKVQKELKIKRNSQKS
jgi:hypothetical protein